MQTYTNLNKVRPDFIRKSGKLFIENEFCAGFSGNKTNVIDPCTEETITKVVEANESNTEKAMQQRSPLYRINGNGNFCSLITVLLGTKA